MGEHFVGREPELARAAAALDAALAGSGQLLLLAGEPGIGKTTLATVIAREAKARAFVTIWARCWDDGAPAFWPFIQILRGIDRELGEATRAELARLPDRARRLARLVPELAPGAEDGAVDRFALFDAVASLLRDLSRARPLLLVIDDLHAVDPSSLSMLRLVAQELKSAHAVVIGTHRELLLGDAPERLDLLARVAREGDVLRLARLGRAEVGRIVEQVAGPAAPVVAELVFRTSEGVPLFVDELLASLSAPGSQLLSGAPIPTGVRAAIKDRLTRLDAETVGVLEIAAVVGPAFVLALVAIAAELDAERVHDLVERAAAARVVERRSAGKYAFTHGLVREALYREIHGARARTSGRRPRRSRARPPSRRRGASGGP